MTTWHRIFTAALVLPLAACGLFQGAADRVITGSGRVTSEARTVSAFSRIALEGQGDVVLQQGSAEALTVEAEDNLLPLITSEVQNGTLRLGFDRATWRDTLRPTQPIRFLVTVTSLEAFDLAGQGSLQAGSLHADTLTVRLTGTGDLTLDRLEAAALEVIIGGTGTVTAAGAVDAQRLEITGNGQYQAGDLDSSTAEVTISGTGDAVIWVRGDLAALISGSGTLSYWGDPTVSRRDVTGTGDINPMGIK
jgi:hypothetical protein